MTAHNDVYRSERAAAGYAFSRPPVHEHLTRKIGQHFQTRTPFARALDVGCGAGRSTAALESLAGTVIGVDPVPAMLTHSRDVARHARFVIASAERLPFGTGVFDLLTAAGSLNYADLEHALPEAARVLTADGVLVIYDFSAGRRFRDGSGLDAWHLEFRRRYTAQPGYHLDVKAIPYSRFGLRLERYDAVEIALPMTPDAYLAYVLTETSVALALSRGVAEEEIRDWCRSTLEPVFAGGSHYVLFDAYVAYVRRGEATETIHHRDNGENRGT